MSICVISVDRDRALVATDTACEVLGHPEHVEVAKLYPLPHAGLALVGLGTTAVSQRAFNKLQQPGKGIDFDTVAERLCGILNAALLPEIDRALTCHAHAKLLGEGNLVYLVGWSRSADRMRARAYLQAPSAASFTEHEIPRWSVQPRDWSAEIAAPTTAEEIEAIAWGAVRYGKSLDASYPYGGRLVIADIRRDTIATHVRPCVGVISGNETPAT